MKLVTVTLGFLCILSFTLSEDTITCLYSEECVLPCQSTLNDIIHWYKGKKAVHSFYDKQDHLDYQAEEYKKRTELFLSEINKGNASLLLKKIRTHDEGTYKCYTASEITNAEKFIDLSVVAPVKSVDITLRDETVTCITSGVYPKPLVSWSPEPPANEPENMYSKTDENLFVVTSTFKRDNVNDPGMYNCSIINEKDQRTLYTASLKQQEISLQDLTAVTLQCPFIKNNPIILSFSTTILTYDSQTSEVKISDEWKDKVSFSPDSGTVKLHNLHKEHLGIYTCESSTAHFRYITRTVIKQTGVTAHTTLAVVIPLLIFLFIIAFFVARTKRWLCFKTQPVETTEKSSEEKPFNTNSGETE